MVPAGWYPDPEGEGWRWWDGTAWGPRNVSEPPGPPARSVGWKPGRGGADPGIDFTSAWAVRVSTAVAVAAGSAAMVAASVVACTFVVGAVPGAAYLVLPGVPVLVAGQLWSLAVLKERAAERRGTGGWWSRNRFRLGDARGGLPGPVGVVFLVLFYGAVLLASVPFVVGFVTTTSGDAQYGVPTDDPSSCEHSVNDHGAYRCLTQSEYEAMQAFEQRFIACVFFGFFVAHCGVATGEVLLRRSGGPTHAGPG